MVLNVDFRSSMQGIYKITKRSVMIMIILFSMLACSSDSGIKGDEKKYDQMRFAMVNDQIKARGVNDESVLKAMRKVERHLFVPPEEIEYAYHDYPLPIGYGQTISQPYIVALMSELARPNADSKILEIGTGSGYQAAVLAEIAKDVYSIEIVEPLYEKSGEILKGLGYSNVHLKLGDGYFGWKEYAPYDAIIVTAAPKSAPDPLIEQLKIGGRLVIPVGDIWQELVVITRTETGIEKESIIPVRFVPMTGEAEEKKH